MELGITNPLQKFLKLKQPPYGTCPDPLFCWDVHRVKIANGKVLMIVSNASTYFVAITRMTAATWKRWEGEAIGAIADSMAASGFDGQRSKRILMLQEWRLARASIVPRVAWRLPKRTAGPPLGIWVCRRTQSGPMMWIANALFSSICATC